MGDNGNLYSVFDSEFPKGMRRLCEMADVLMPNLTELCFMLDLEYKEGPYTQEYIDSVFKEAEVFGLKKIVITGVSFEEGKVGAVFKDYETDETGQVMRDIIEGYYHGTGDVFGSSLVGALESGLELKESVRIAVDFTVESIRRTFESGADVRYGVDFEPGLNEYSYRVGVLREGLIAEFALRETDYFRLSGMASKIWHEAYIDIVPDDQIEYMLEKYLSPKAISK
jgi:pyridoxine kinase